MHSVCAHSLCYSFAGAPALFRITPTTYSIWYNLYISIRTLEINTYHIYHMQIAQSQRANCLVRRCERVRPSPDFVSVFIAHTGPSANAFFGLLAVLLLCAIFSHNCARAHPAAAAVLCGRRLLFYSQPAVVWTHARAQLAQKPILTLRSRECVSRAGRAHAC